MENKTKIFALAGGLFVSGMFSCNSAEKRAQAERERQEAIADSIAHVKDSIKKAEAARIQAWDDANDRILDSIENANGFKKINAELHDLRSSYDDKEDLRKIEASKTLGGAMNAAIEKSGTEILQKFDAEMRKLMGVYDLGYNASLFNEEMYNVYELNEMIFYNPKNQDYYGDWGFERWQRAIYEKVEESYYGDERKSEIKQSADAIIDKMKSELDANRKAVIAQFDKYISVAEPRETLGMNAYRGEGQYGYGFDEVTPNAKYTITSKRASVYDQNLKMNFFGDEDCSYKLVSVEPGKWQVVKTHKNGKVEKTHVFSDNVKFQESSDELNEKPDSKVGDAEFYYYPGTNLGVHVSYNEVTNIRENKNVWTPPAYTLVEQQKMDSLRAEIECKEELKQTRDSLWNIGLEISREITNRRFGPRGK